MCIRTQFVMNFLAPFLLTDTYPLNQEKMSRKNRTTLQNFQLFTIEKYFIFRQTFVNTYYALAHLTLGIEQPYDDEEDDGNSAQQETGDDANQSTDDVDTLRSDDDPGHVQGSGEARDQGTDQEANPQGKQHGKQEL